MGITDNVVNEQLNISSDTRSHNGLFVVKISLVAALGGLLFGYDTAVIAGAIGFLQIKFQLTPTMVGWVASSAIWGCVVGVLLAGGFSDRLGRKWSLIITAFVFGASGILSAIPNDLITFIAARFAGGIAVGAVSMLAPLYISEVSPANIRGRMVTLYQLAIVIGINLIYYVNMQIESSGDIAWNTETGWRWMLGSETIPAMIFLALLSLVPESPRWLIRKRKNEKALAILERINGLATARKLSDEISRSLMTEQSGVQELLNARWRVPLVIGIVLALFSQITGINAIIYYAPEILQRTGMGSTSAFSQTFIIGLVNTAFTLLALWLIDVQGRRRLLLWGIAGMVVCLFGTGFCFYREIMDGPWILMFILGFIACFASSLGPIPWIIMSEIFPNKVRGIAMSVAVLALWVGVILITQFTPVLLEVIGGAWLFWIFMVNAIVLLLFAWRYVPETKNLSLEEIEILWSKKG